VLGVLGVRGVLGVLGVLELLGVLGVLEVRGAAQADGVITGQVLDGLTGRPVGAAIVSVTGAGMTVTTVGSGLPNQPPSILTGGDGRFVFRGLQIPGTFSVTATKGGYADGASGRRRPGGPSQPVALAAGATSADVVVRVWKYGAITGTVSDEAGEPMVGVQVRALIRTRQDPGSESFVGPAGFTRMLGRPFTTAATTYTDDRGIYRFGNLSTGDYLVVASVPPVSAGRTVLEDIGRSGRGGAAGDLTALFSSINATPLQIGDTLYTIARGAPLPLSASPAHVPIYPPTFYPSAAGPSQASIVSLAIGEERMSVDIQLAPVRTARISGIALTASGPVFMTGLRLVALDGETVPSNVIEPTSVTDSAGAFTFAAVVPGRYVLRASVSGGPGPAGISLSMRR